MDEQFELDGQGLVKNDDNSGDVNSFSSDEVLEEIERQKSGKRSWINNLIILGISLLVFFRLGLINNGVGDIVSIIFVLFIHEMGHLIGMRMFGYKNVQMFFIPMLGAAVSGQGQNTPGYKKAIVSLMGPVPGIFIGIGCMIASFFLADGQWCYRLGVMFAAINGFNLLPFFPLDGGRVVYDILFSRNQYLELIFRVLAALALIGAGLLMEAWVLGIFGLVNLMCVAIPFKLAKIAKQIRQLHFSKDENIYANLEAEESTEETNCEDIPGHIADDIVERVCGISGKMSLKVAASHTKEVWERVQIRHPGILATVLLLGFYLFVFCLPVVGLVGGATINAFRSGDYDVCKIVEYETPDGEIRQKEQVYVFGDLSRETDLSEDGKLYHGRAVVYYSSDGSVLKEGMWYEGKWDGESKTYDMDGKVISKRCYDKGKFVWQKDLEDGQWVEKGWDDLSAFRRNILKEHENAPPEGPKVMADAEDSLEDY